MANSNAGDHVSSLPQSTSTSASTAASTFGSAPRSAPRAADAWSGATGPTRTRRAGRSDPVGDGSGCVWAR